MIFTAVFTLVSFMLLLYFGIDIFSAFDVFFNIFIYNCIYISFAQVGRLCDTVSQRLDGRPYALLGHSLGAIIAYEVAREMIRRNNPAPIHVCISSVLPPSHADFHRDGITSQISDADFLKHAEERCWLTEMKDRTGKLGNNSNN